MEADSPNFLTLNTKLQGHSRRFSKIPRSLFQKSRNNETLLTIIRAQILEGTDVMSDEYRSSTTGRLRTAQAS